jgi:hypothetical protein
MAVAAYVYIAPRVVADIGAAGYRVKGALWLKVTAAPFILRTGTPVSVWRCVA